MNAATDYRLELIQSPPEALLPSETPAVPVDLTDRLLLDGLSSISRAVERDLLSFRTGDLTVTLRNHDGYLEELFAFLEPGDRWQMRLYRRNELQAFGIVMGKGSIIYNRTDKTCEITAYGPSRILDDTGATELKRSFATDLRLTAALSVGATNITASTTLDLLTRDQLHLMRAAQTAKEDVTIRYVTSATGIALAAGVINTYANNDPIIVQTPYYRYKPLRWLVEELFKLAKIPLAEYRTTGAQFRMLGPTPIAHGGLGSTNIIRSPGCLRVVDFEERIYAVLGNTGSYYQPLDRPDADWVQEDATTRPWMDWSRYRKQSEGAPNIILRFPDALPASAGTAAFDEHEVAVDDRDATTKYLYRFRINASNVQLVRNSTTDGTTWTGWADFGAVGPAVLSADNGRQQCEFDPVRAQIYVVYNGASGIELYLYDVAGNSWSTIFAGTRSDFGFRYIPEEDYVLASYQAAFGYRYFVGYRNGGRIFDRNPNSFRYILDGNSIAQPTFPVPDDVNQQMSLCARWVDGRIYLLGLYDNAVVLLNTEENFQTLTVKAVVPASLYTTVYASRVGNHYYFFPHGSNSANDKTYHIAAPFYAGVVAYADFENKSVGESLGDLAIISNSVYWVDESLGGHFVARDLIGLSEPSTIDDLIKDRQTTHLWDEAALFSKISGGDFEEVAGEEDFASEGIEVQSDLIPNQAFAHSLAQAYYDFYSKRRRTEEMTVRDVDGRIFYPLDRVTIEGIRYLVYESDQDLGNDEVRLSLVEDV